MAMVEETPRDEAAAPPPQRRGVWVLVLERQGALAVLVLIAVALAFWLPCIVEPTYWGMDMWDRTAALAGTARVTILRYRQFPFWNPYMSGGLPLLANPETAFLSPSFATVLLAGEVVGIRLRVLCTLCVGLIGGYLLGRWLTSGPYAAYVTAVVFLLSSWYPLYMMTGHEEFLAFAYLPWAVLLYERACAEWRWALPSGAVLALMMLEGGVYPVPYTSLMLGFYALILTVGRRSLGPLVALLVTLVFGGALAGSSNPPSRGCWNR